MMQQCLHRRRCFPTRLHSRGTSRSEGRCLRRRELAHVGTRVLNWCSTGMPCAIMLDAPRTGDGVNADALESQHALALRPGVLLADRYRLVRATRGASSFAFSYHAEDLSTGEPVVIKEFFPRSLVSREADGLSVRAHSQECERDFLRALHRFALEGAALA